MFRERGHLPWRSWNICPLIFLNLIHILVEVNLLWFQPLRFYYHLPANEQDREDKDHHVAEQESWDVPTIQNEDRVSSNKGHDEAAGESIPCAEWLPPRFVRKRVTRKSLSLTGILEFDESESHDGKVYQLGSGDLKRLAAFPLVAHETHQADEPAQNHGCVVADLQEAQQRDQEDNTNAVDGHSVPGAFC